jgi:hypothetical protein
MKNLLITCAALASLAAVAPASAQPWRGGDGDFGNFQGREARAERQIEWCQRRGGLSWREAQSLRYELRRLEREIAAARYGGLDRRETYMLEARMDRLERRIREECRDNDNYRGDRDRDRDGVPNRYDRYDNNPYRH